MWKHFGLDTWGISSNHWPTTLPLVKVILFVFHHCSTILRSIIITIILLRCCPHNFGIKRVMCNTVSELDFKKARWLKESSFQHLDKTNASEIHVPLGVHDVMICLCCKVFMRKNSPPTTIIVIQIYGCFSETFTKWAKIDI